MFAHSLYADGPTLKRLYPAGAARGASVDVSALGDAPKWPVQIWSDDPAIKWEALADKGKFRVSVDAQAALGIHHVRFYDADNSTDAMRFMVGTIGEQNEVEPNDSGSKAMLLTELPKLINGVLEKRSDADTFAVDLTAGQTLVAAIEANEHLRSPVDATLQILSANGSVLAQQLDTLGLDPVVTYTAARAGRHMVRVFGFPETPDSTINFAGGENFVYRLTVAHGGWVNATRPLAVARQAPTPLNLLGIGLPQHESTVTVPPTFKRAEWPLEATGLVNAISLDVLDLPIAVESPIAPASADKPLVPQVLVVPSSITGTLANPREKDRYGFSASKATKLRFELHSRRFGLPMDGVLRILDTSGKQLAREDDAAKKVDTKLTFSPPADGEYMLEVSDLHSGGGQEWVYRIDLQPVLGDARLTVKTDHYQGKLNEPLEVAVAIDRRDGFDKPLRIVATGLPEAIDCPVVVSEKEGHTAKEVKLILTPKAAYSGPFRISATVEADPTFATTATATGDPLLSDIWVKF